MKFNEDSRVKIPTILHCMRLGYDYVSLKNAGCVRDESTNIFSAVFLSSVQRINPGLSDNEARQALDEISLTLENEDLGRAFYKKLINNMKLSVPKNQKIIFQFNEQVNAIFKKIELNKKSNQELVKLRAWLLPMLMNGQVTVGETSN